MPGVTILGDNALPNYSGKEDMRALPGTKSDRASRIAGTFSYEDMAELAIDFATAIAILKDVQPLTESGQVTDPRIGLVNHVFAPENHHGRSPLTDRYTPSTIPALVGFQIGLRTTEPANVALEITIELTDENGDRLQERGSTVRSFRAPHTTYSVGG